MKYILTIVEQLDRAIGELAIDHPINNRLALILIDNATELILHRQCMGRLELDKLNMNHLRMIETILEHGSQVTPPELADDLRNRVLTPKQRKSAKGKFLDDKLKVLEKVGDLSSSERRFIAIAHEYRGELYHVGLSHDDIIRAIAGCYFMLCCDLFVRMSNLGVMGVTISSDDVYSDVAKRYLPLRDGRLDLFNVEYGTLADKLRSGLPDGLPQLSETLAASANSAIEEAVESFDFLISSNPRGMDDGEMLEQAQWDQDLAKALEKYHVDDSLTGAEYREIYTKAKESIAEDWYPRQTSIPSERWLRRSMAVAREPDPLVAMALYQSLRNDMSYLEEAIQSEAYELDRWIENEIDRRRGK